MQKVGNEGLGWGPLLKTVTGQGDNSTAKAASRKGRELFRCCHDWCRLSQTCKPTILGILPREIHLKIRWFPRKFTMLRTFCLPLGHEFSETQRRFWKKHLTVTHIPFIAVHLSTSCHVCPTSGRIESKESNRMGTTSCKKRLQC